ncbi:MAG: COG4648 family protein, partial [Gammaproteobacteria bacterium]
MIRSSISTVAVLALLAYPATIFFAAGHVTPKVLMAGVLALLALRVGFTLHRKSSLTWQQWSLSGLLIVAALAVLFSHGISMNNVKLYPVVIDFSIFLLFFGSLFTHQPLVERIARAQRDELDSQALLYTRRITCVWSAVLLVNAAVALYTALYASVAIWTFYNGLLSYVLIGMVFLVELLIRQRVRRRF